jgi:hypothetical protein
MTELGRPAVEAYAARGGQTEEEYLQQLPEPLTSQAAGAALVELLHANPGTIEHQYLLTGAGLKKLP